MKKSKSVKCALCGYRIYYLNGEMVDAVKAHLDHCVKGRYYRKGAIPMTIPPAATSVRIDGMDLPWPEDCKYFRSHTGDDEGLFEFLGHNFNQVVAAPQKYKNSSTERMLLRGLPETLPIIAAVAARHFRNKANSIRRNQIAVFENYNQLIIQAENAAEQWEELCNQL